MPVIGWLSLVGGVGSVRVVSLERNGWEQTRTRSGTGWETRNWERTNGRRRGWERTGWKGTDGEQTDMEHTNREWSNTDQSRGDQWGTGQ